MNCFLAEGEKAWKVIDTGLHNKETVKRWDDELKGKEVTDIIITHYHPDHFGYAGGLQEKTGAKVSMTKIDAESGATAWSKEFLDGLGNYYALAGIPSSIAKDMIDDTRAFIPRVTPYPTIQHYLEEGDSIVIGKYEYEVFHTPGHSDGLVSFYNKDRNVLISTDHILPRITPNISYWFHGDPNPLNTYLHSLDKIQKLEAEFVIPCHGKPFYGANARIAEIKAHHEERLDFTLESVRNDSGSVYDVTKKLFAHVKTIHEVRFAVGETIAHLEYLRERGELDRELRDGVYWYFN